MKFENEPKKPPMSGYQLYSSTYIGSLSHLATNEKFKVIVFSFTISQNTFGNNYVHIWIIDYYSFLNYSNTVYTNSGMDKVFSYRATSKISVCKGPYF